MREIVALVLELACTGWTIEDRSRGVRGDVLGLDLDRVRAGQ